MQARPAPLHSVRLPRRHTRHLHQTTMPLLPTKCLKIPTVRQLTKNHLLATVLLRLMRPLGNPTVGGYSMKLPLRDLVHRLSRLLLRAIVLLCRTKLLRTLTVLQPYPTKSLPQDTVLRRTKLLLQVIMLLWILSAFPLTRHLLRDTVLHLSKLPETLVAQVWIHLVASILPMASLRIPTLFHASRNNKT